jgi:ankyrin repeat protein
MDVCFAAWTGNVPSLKNLTSKAGTLSDYTCAVHGWNPANLAVFNSHVAFLELFLNKETANRPMPNFLATPSASKFVPPVHWAAKKGDPEAIRALKNAGGDVSVQDGDGETAMHWAADRGHVDVIKALKELGGDVCAKNEMGETAMHWAAWNGHVDAIEALKELGGDVCAKDENGTTAMYLATRNGHVDAIKALKELGGDV